MKYKLAPTRLIPTMFLVISLAACSSGPSESEIKSLIDREIKPVMEMQWRALEALGGAKTTLDDVKKLACKADGDAAYKCDVELQISSGGKKESKAVPIRFVKTSSGWNMTK